MGGNDPLLLRVGIQEDTEGCLLHSAVSGHWEIVSVQPYLKPDSCTYISFLRISRAAVNKRAEMQVGRGRRKRNLMHMVVKHWSGVRQMSKDEVGGRV